MDAYSSSSSKSQELSTLAVISAMVKIAHYYLSSRIKQVGKNEASSSHSLSFHTKTVLFLIGLFIIDTMVMIKSLPFLVDGAIVSIAGCLSLAPHLWLILSQYSILCYGVYSDRSIDDDGIEWQIDIAYIIYQLIRLFNNTALAVLQYNQYGRLGDMGTLCLINFASIGKRALEWRDRRQSIQVLVGKMKTVRVDDKDMNDICLICRDSLQQVSPSNEKMKVSKCNAVKRLPNCRHLYHQDCLIEWLQCRLQCPACRRAVK